MSTLQLLFGGESRSELLEEIVKLGKHIATTMDLHVAGVQAYHSALLAPAQVAVTSAMPELPATDAALMSDFKKKDCDSLKLRLAELTTALEDASVDLINLGTTADSIDCYKDHTGLNGSQCKNGGSRRKAWGYGTKALG